LTGVFADVDPRGAILVDQHLPHRGILDVLQRAPGTVGGELLHLRLVGKRLSGEFVDPGGTVLAWVFWSTCAWAVPDVS